MTNNKPEWFEMAENDGPVKPARASKTLPLAAVFASVLILGIGAVIGQVKQESPAIATETSATATEQKPATSSAPNETTATDTTIATNSSTASKIPTKQSSKPSASATQSTSLQNPSIAKLPTNGGDDDDDDDDDEEDDDEEDDD